MPPKSGKPNVRIGCYSAFLGDSPEAASQLVYEEGANLDYLVADYLAEITMGVLALKKNARLLSGNNKDPISGEPGADYINQFVNLILKKLLPDLQKNKTKVITNAGALDPHGCKAAIEKLFDELNIKGMKVAAVVGDDMMNGENITTLEAFKKDIVSFSPLSVKNLDLDADRFPVNNEPIVSMNAYLGAKGIAAALEAGADIVITGRVVDSAIVVGPLMYEYGWDVTKHKNYYDLLGSASLAGHIIECGCHATGGNFTDWRQAAYSPYGGYSNMGYPIVEFEESGEFVVTKPVKTGGLVTVGTVAEQILYETLDPALYILADVILDMRQVQLTQVGDNRVHVKGAKGYQATPFVKCCGIFMDGWSVNGTLIIGGEDAKGKAEAVGKAIIARARRILKERGIGDFREFNIEPLGTEIALFGANARSHATREVVLRVSAVHNDRKALQMLSNEIMAPVTCMAPGTGFGNQAIPLPNLVHFPCLLPKSKSTTEYLIGSSSQRVDWDDWDDALTYQNIPPLPPIPTASETSGLVKTKLISVAFGRSGDKGDVSNVGIIARDPKYLPYIKRSVTEEVIGNYMQHLCQGSVKRYELPGLLAFNFVLTHALGKFL
ncbi:hypothetical protein BDB00DRAFT_755277 [Zychaea mexicana]|uniref:uncharacterized protein n=1 Tax=Zychaea mexicana TaxID=64656 RepID=UPI0022FF1449|nr:uncharacterized protein BDB00DRAFT_755277 [Zychaea mexicana]KAI9498069.1 hypothetical protein BDB00DRAFT_755277 [Zychaea mexicana]